jgi:prophage antirepressor-like protein
MKNNLEIFSSNEFGELRTINENGKVMFIASDVAKMLGYTNTSKAISDHCRYVTKRYIPHPQGKGTLEVNFIPEGDVYRLITHSKLPAAEKFESWVFDEVLPSIRKTGSYTAKPLDESKTKRLAIMERNAKVREAALWAKLAEGSSGTYQQVCKAYAANTLAEKDVVSLPKAEEKTYTATEIGNMLNVSAHRIGRLANLHKLKTAEYGSWYHDKSKHSNKEVETFRYNAKAINKFRQILHCVDTDSETAELVGDIAIITE